MTSVCHERWRYLYDYDRYGNLKAKDLQSGSVGSHPHIFMTYDATTNQIADAGYVYDDGGDRTVYFRSALSGKVLEEWVNGARDKFYVSVAGEHLATFTPGPAVTSRRHPLATLPPGLPA